MARAKKVGMRTKKVAGAKRVKQIGTSHRESDKKLSAKKPSASENRANRTDRGKYL